MSISIDLLPNENSNSNIKLEIKDKETTYSRFSILIIIY